LIPIRLPKTSTTGLILLVVQLAHEKIDVFPSSEFTPCTTVGVSSLLVGAEITTVFAPAVMCFAASSLLVKNPVLSITISMLSSLQGSSSGLRLE